MNRPTHAISVKQPWAALIVHGLKTIEIRTWGTRRRGPILIHAAKVSDPRAEAWAGVPPELRAAAELTGGILGTACLTDCKVYIDRCEFAEEQGLHLNDPSWFDPRGMFGFVLTEARVLPFQPYPGWVRFFRVDASSD